MQDKIIVQNRRKSFFSVVIAMAIIIATFYTGAYIQKRYGSVNFLKADVASASSTAVDSKVNLDLYYQVLNLLEEKQIKAETISGDEKLYGMIQGLAASYKDPYTTFFPPSEAENFKTSVAGAFEGVGMEVGMKNNTLTVISPLKNSPAEKAGIKADDKIIGVNATTTENMSVEAAIKLIRGPKGTPVTLKIFRGSENKIKEITIIREKIDLPIVDTAVVGNAFKISLYSFSENSPVKFEAALKEFVASGKKNLIIDVRNNPGGYLEAAVMIASFFVEKDKNIVSEDFTRKNLKTEHVSKGFVYLPSDIKVIVLVNKGSASASEILAGALQDYKKAKILGEVSFGKGSVQEYIELPQKTSVKITVAKWLTPNGNSISDHGVTPDIIVPFKENLKNKKADNQLDYALKVFYSWNTFEKYNANDKTQINTASSTPK